MATQWTFPLPRRALRLAGQTAAAALATYAAVEATGLPEGSWAVITALFACEASVGGTLGAAVGRLAGTALGTLIGLGCALLIGISDWRTALGLLLIALTVTAVAARYPSTRFGVVAGSIILLVPEGDLVAKAWERAVAIGLGTVIGTLAALFLFPERAHRNAEAHLGRAIRRCGDLLATAVALLTGEAGGDLRAIHDDIRRELQAASEMTGESLAPQLKPGAAAAPGDLLRATQRLWHTLILIDRAEQGPLPEDPCERLRPALRALSDAFCGYIADLGGAVERGEAPPRQDALRERLRTLDAAIEAMRRDGATRPLPSAEAERVFALSFAMRQLARDLDAFGADRRAAAARA